MMCDQISSVLKKNIGLYCIEKSNTTKCIYFKHGQQVLVTFYDKIFPN